MLKITKHVTSGGVRYTVEGEDDSPVDVVGGRVYVAQAALNPEAAVVFAAAVALAAGDAGAVVVADPEP